MLIREYKDGDLESLRAIHRAQGFDYALPDLRNPLFVTRLVLTHEPPQEGAETRSSKVTSHESPITNQEASSTDLDDTSRKGNCRILGAALLRLTAEAYLLLDPRAGTPRERWQWLL